MLGELIDLINKVQEAMRTRGMEPSLRKEKPTPSQDQLNIDRIFEDIEKSRKEKPIGK